jgi:hypothetical protein
MRMLADLHYSSFADTHSLYRILIISHSILDREDDR